MNTRKMTGDKITLVKMCMALSIPYKIIAKMLQVNEATVRKYTKKEKEVLNETGPSKTRGDLKVELFKLYAWSIYDITDVAMSFAISTDEIQKMQNAIFDYLHLDRYIAYCDGVLDQMKEYQQLDFHSNIPEHYQKLIKTILGAKGNEYGEAKFSGKKMFEEHCLSNIYQNPDTMMPNTDELLYPGRALKRSLASLLKNSRNDIALFVPESFVGFLNKNIQQTTARQKAVLYKKFKFPDYKEYKNLTEDLSPPTINKIYNQALKSLRLTLGEMPAWNKTLSIFLESFEIDVVNKEEKIKIINEGERIRVAASNLSDIVIEHLDRQFFDEGLVALLIAIDPETTEKLKLEGKFFEPLSGDVRSDIKDHELGFYLKDKSDMDLSTRLYNLLQAVSINYGWEIVEFSKSDYLKFRNFGKKSLVELEELLRGKNLSFGKGFLRRTKKYLIEKTYGTEKAIALGYV